MRDNMTSEPDILNSRIHPSSYLDIFSKIHNSKLDKGAKVYKLAWVKDSILDENSSVGDFSKIEASSLGSYVRIGRFNQIYKSNFGDHSYTGPGSVVMNATIGKYNSISWNVSIGPAEHDYKKVTNHSFLYNSYDNIRPEYEDAAYDRFEEPCVLGHDVWVGTGAVILRNISIGNGSVIGANAVVNREIPPYSIAVGSPARIVKCRFDNPVIAKLLQIEWWNFPDRVIKENYRLFSSFPNNQVLNEMMRIKKDLES